MNATLIYSDDGVRKNSSRYRIINPGKYLLRAGHDVHIIHQSEFNRLELLSDVILVEREIDPARIRTLRSLGVKRILVTFDDAYHLIPRSSLSWAYWRKIKSLETFRAAIKLADDAVTPSPVLSRDYGVSVLWNYHDPELWDFERPLRDPDRVVIGWGGSATHDVTWGNPLFADVLATAQRKHPQIDVVIYGHVADDSLHTAGTRFKSYPSVSFDEWPKAVATFDIFLIPLSGPYDLRRSDLKAVEAGLAGIPFIASQKGPFRGLRGGIVCENSKGAWLKAIEQLLDRDRRREVAQLALPFIRERLFPEGVRAYERLLWPEVYI